jgi:FlaA1/EpsC-like NDP-sugar epimerase
MPVFSGVRSAILGWSRAAKRLVVVLLDVAMSLFATWLAFTLRLDNLHWPTGYQWLVYAIAPVFVVPVFIRFGLYRAIFRYSGQAALLATAKAIAISGGLLTAVLLWQKWPGVPRSLGVLQPLLFLLLVAASRGMARFWLAGADEGRKKSEGRLLIFGAGVAGVQTASAIGISGQYVLLGFVDDDAGKVGRSINGVPVLALGDVPHVVATQGVTDILLALPSVSRERRNGIIESLRALPVHIRTLPGMADLASGRVTVRDFRELDIEDLLGRDPVPPDEALLAGALADRVVLVTGAGGSIGGELCRQIIQHRPQRLILLDHNEFGLYSIHRELQALCLARSLSVTLVPLLGSVTNAARIKYVFEEYRPAVVYHAAAYKHVPLVESNGGEGIINNVFGTMHVALAALAAGVGRFVLISTDKAVRPTNIMGASKRMAELVLQALALEVAAPPNESASVISASTNRGETANFGIAALPKSASSTATCFTIVRFGNVLGSSGSVVPLFRRQLEEGGPLTLTHAEVTRYFMTIPEAAQLVLQAGAMAQGGDVFVLDMGKPVKIRDLAERMIKLSGLELRDESHPDGDIAIHVTGLRPGEKLYEELLIGDDPQPTGHPRIMKAHEQYLDWATLSQQLRLLESAALRNDLPAIAGLLTRNVQGYTAQESIAAGESSVDVAESALQDS